MCSFSILLTIKQLKLLKPFKKLQEKQHEQVFSSFSILLTIKKLKLLKPFKKLQEKQHEYLAGLLHCCNIPTANASAYDFEYLK